MSDEDLYLRATQEVESGSPDAAIWAKAMAICEGDEKSAKYKYVKLRVEKLEAEEPKKELEDYKKTIDLSADEEGKSNHSIKAQKFTHPGVDNSTEAPNGHVTLAEAAQVYSIDKDQIVKLIQDGELIGVKMRNDWFVYRDSLNKYIEEANKKGFFSKLASGDYGLAMTYWVYGVLVSLVVQVIFRGLEEAQFLELILFLSLPVIGYALVQMCGVWNASLRYDGPVIFSLMAKITVVLGALFLVVTIFALLGVVL